MKKVFSVAFLIVFVMNLYAQKQTFDMVNYEMPKGWDKIVTENGVQLSTKDDGKGNYAAVVILRSVVSTATANDNFNNSWNNLVKGTVKVSAAPTMSDMDIEKNWTCITGQANYTDGDRKGLVTLITATGGDKMVNVVVMTNTQNYQEELLALVNSLELAKIKQQEEGNTGQLGKSSVVGLWTNYILETTGYNVGGMPQYTAGYLRKEYNFNANGTYTFRNKQWLTKAPDITFLYETGTYSIKGNQLTLTPVSGKGGFWAKTNSTKEWGRLKKYTDYKLEKTTYTIEIINDPTYGKSIVLKPSKPTQRDGGQFNAPNDPLEFRYSFRDIESLIDNPPGFKN